MLMVRPPEEGGRLQLFKPPVRQPPSPRWNEESQHIGSSSLVSVFTVDCRPNQQPEVDRGILVRFPVYSLEQWKEGYPVEYINVWKMKFVRDTNRRV